MPRKGPALLLTAILLLPLAAPLSAEEASLAGTVTEVFGRQVIVATSEGRVLVSLPEGVEVPRPGARVDVTGTRDGATFAATAFGVSATAGPPDAALPDVLRGLGLTDVRTRRDRDDEMYIHARLPGGGWLRAEERRGRLIEAQSDGAGLPDEIVSALLPAAVRSEPRLADVARFTEIDLDDGRIDVEGVTAEGVRIDMEFSPSGTLLEYERERHDDRRSLTEGEARQRLLGLGYQEIGFVHRGGRHVEAFALNPDGDWVEIRLDERGRIERERLWAR